MFLEGLLLVGAYFIGSIPFGLLLTRIAGLPDLRRKGSGNTGATNVLRVGSRKLAFFTLLFDILKGSAAVFLALFVDPDLAPLAGFFAVLGHVFPIWLQFQGGKGVATTLGIMMVLSWPTVMVASMVWAGVAYFTRYASVASLSAVLTIPFVLYEMRDDSLISLSLVIVVLIFYTHRDNIYRLFSKNEPKMGEKSHDGNGAKTEKTLP